MRKTYKQIMAGVLTLAIGVAAISFPATKSYAAEAETSWQAVNNIITGWNLGNSLDSNGDWIEKYTNNNPEDYEKAWGNPVTTKELITTVKEAGFNAVRVPVTWGEHLDENGTIDETWMKRVQEVIDYVMSQDLYCIVNVHHDGGTDGIFHASGTNYTNHSKLYETIWKQIATRFQSYNHKLLFEGLNEILDDNNNWGTPSTDGFTAVNKYNQLFVDTVRKTGGNNATRNLILMTYAGSGTEAAIQNFKVPTDSTKDHLIMEVHNYDPQPFTWSDITWATMRDTWGTAADKAMADNSIQLLSKYSKSYNLPAIIGEYGADDKNNIEERIKYASYYIGNAAKNGIKCFWWDTGSMALFDRSAATNKFPSLTSAIVKAAKDNMPASAVTDNSGNNSSSNQTATTPSVLPAPTVTAKKSGSTVTLSWKAIENATYYYVYEYNKETKKYDKIATLKSTSKKLKNLKKGTYKYKVAAVERTSEGLVKGTSSKTKTVTVK